MTEFNKFYNQARRTGEGELQLEIFGMSEAGQHKTTNEDAFLITDINASGKLMAVADGFGNLFGEESSRLAVCLMREALRFSSNLSIAERLEKAIEIAHRKIKTHFQNIHHSKAVGTTLTAVCVVEDRAYIAHIGNSRAYLVRGKRIEQLTVDHTFAQVLINSGVEPNAAARKTLLQAIGVDCELAPMLVQTKLLPDDYLLVCSDGFSNRADAAEIVRVIEGNADLSVAAEQLVEAANERDGSDNITLILARAFRAATASREFYSFWHGSMPQRIGA